MQSWWWSSSSVAFRGFAYFGDTLKRFDNASLGFGQRIICLILTTINMCWTVHFGWHLRGMKGGKCSISSHRASHGRGGRTDKWFLPPQVMLSTRMHQKLELMSFFFLLWWMVVATMNLTTLFNYPFGQIQFIFLMHCHSSALNGVASTAISPPIFVVYI